MTYYDSYQFSHGRTEVTDSNGDTYDFCERIEVLEVRWHLDTSVRNWLVGVTQSDGRVLTVEGAPSAFIKDPVGTLAGVGLNISNVVNYTTTVAEILILSEASAAISWYHSSLGFTTFDNERVFLSREMLGHSTAISTYMKAERLAAKGSVESWITSVSNLCSGRPTIQLALAIAVVAPIAALLKESAVIDITPVYALVGKSSSGKTTMLKLMASVWGKPVVGDGVISTMNCTQAFFYEMLSERNGFPVFVDELSSVPDMDFTSLVYDIASSQEKGKCPGGKPILPKSWAGAVIFTGERSLLAQTNQNEGLYARALELPFCWTETPEEAEMISEFVGEQHGTAYEPIVEFLLKLGASDLKAIFSEWTTQLVDYLHVSDGVQRRAAKLCAILMTALQIVDEVFELDVSYPEMVELVAEAYEATLPERSTVDKVYAMLTSWIVAHLERFPTEKDTTDSRNRPVISGIWGIRSHLKKEGCDCVFILDSYFEELLLQKGFHDVKHACGLLYEAKKLCKFGDRYRKPRKIAGVEATWFCLLLPGSLRFTEEKTEPPSKHSPNRAYLLADNAEDID